MVGDAVFLLAMPRTAYVNLSEIAELETKIMLFVGWWVHEKKTPIPRYQIILKMQTQGVVMPATRFAIYALLSKGYLREAVAISNKTSYVQLRSVPGISESYEPKSCQNIK